jgi:hypothetical protein
MRISRLRPRPKPRQVPMASGARHARGQAWADRRREKSKERREDRGHEERRDDRDRGWGSRSNWGDGTGWDW